MGKLFNFNFPIIQINLSAKIHFLTTFISNSYLCIVIIAFFHSYLIFQFVFFIYIFILFFSIDLND
jgi:hypothetical protein